MFDRQRFFKAQLWLKALTAGVFVFVFLSLYHSIWGISHHWMNLMVAGLAGALGWFLSDILWLKLSKPAP